MRGRQGGRSLALSRLEGTRRRLPRRAAWNAGPGGKRLPTAASRRTHPASGMGSPGGPGLSLEKPAVFWRGEQVILEAFHLTWAKPNRSESCDQALSKTMFLTAVSQRSVSVWHCFLGGTQCLRNALCPLCPWLATARLELLARTPRWVSPPLESTVSENYSRRETDLRPVC